MRGMSLCAKGYHRRKSSYGREKAIEEIVKENLLNRQFEQSQIDAVWVTDINYIPCSDGRLYLSTYIDLAIRIPHFYTVDSCMKKEIVVQPLEVYKCELPTVIHSDSKIVCLDWEFSLYAIVGNQARSCKRGFY